MYVIAAAINIGLQFIPPTIPLIYLAIPICGKAHGLQYELTISP